MTEHQRLFTNDYQISTNSYVRIYKQIMQNKPNFRNDKMNICPYLTMIYVKFRHLTGWKNKANSNPIKPKQTQFKPNLSQFKANLSKGQKMLEFTLSLSPRTARLTRNRGMLAHLLWSLPSVCAYLLFCRGSGAFAWIGALG
jgi:hypothetical protein